MPFVTPVKPVKLCVTALRIDAHLRRIAEEEEKTIVRGSGKFCLPRAIQAGPYVRLRYKSTQKDIVIPRVEAEAYLKWLDAGNVGTHRDMQAAVLQGAGGK